MIFCIYMYRINGQNNRISLLLAKNKKIYHTQDLGVLWGISNTNTLYKTIERYTDKGILQPIYKGMYTTIGVGQLNPWLLGVKALHSYAYVSCETILFNHGLINQPPSSITLVSSISKRFQIDQHIYRARQLQDQFLYNQIGVEQHNDVYVASAQRAMVDMLYFNPHMHFDSNIDWQKINALQKLIGYSVTQRL